jgi:hypothetical protein
VVFFGSADVFAWWAAGLIVLVVDVCLLTCIQQVACDRDYS